MLTKTHSPLLSAARTTKCLALLLLLLQLLLVLGTAAAAVCLAPCTNNDEWTPLASILVLLGLLPAAWHSTCVLSWVLAWLLKRHRASGDRLNGFDTA